LAIFNAIFLNWWWLTFLGHPVVSTAGDLRNLRAVTVDHTLEFSSASDYAH